jgi:hypothetical protein
MSKDRDAHAVVQEVRTIDVDCCLTELETILATVASMSAEGVDVLLREPDAGSSRIDRGPTHTAPAQAGESVRRIIKCAPETLWLSAAPRPPPGLRGDDL